MKNVNMFKRILFVVLFLGSFGLTTLQAQSSVCDTCSNVWGPIQKKVYYNQTINGLMPYCLFNVHLNIQTRICNGKVQVRLIDQYIEPLSTDPSCNLACFHVGTLMQKISKLLLVDLGGNIVLSKPSSCYYLLEFGLTPDLILCMGKEAGLHPNWYSVIPCDGNGCCVTEYILQADGSVRTVTSVSTPCLSSPPSPVPTSIIVYCWNGPVRTPYVVPVISPTIPLTCELACSTTGYIFTAKKTNIDEENADKLNSNVVYPNPTNGELNIASNVEWKTLSIMDLQGRVMSTHQNSKQKIDVKNLAPGNYLILLQKENGTKEKYYITKK